MTIKAASYGLVLITSTVYVALSGTYDSLAPFYAFVFIGGVVSVFALLRNMQFENKFEPSTTPGQFRRKAHP
jgi:hypothetical protein